jgi:hypothetical protein
MNQKPWAGGCWLPLLLLLGAVEVDDGRLLPRLSCACRKGRFGDHRGCMMG